MGEASVLYSGLLHVKWRITRTAYEFHMEEVRIDMRWRSKSVRFQPSMPSLWLETRAMDGKGLSLTGRISIRPSPELHAEVRRTASKNVELSRTSQPPLLCTASRLHFGQELLHRLDPVSQRIYVVKWPEAPRLRPALPHPEVFHLRHADHAAHLE